MAFLSLVGPGIAHKKLDAATKLKNLPPGENVLWTDPGNVAALNFVYGVGGREGAPREPFTFLQEEMSGTNPKVKVRDGNGTNWSVKFGSEARPSVFATRLVWACGYSVETEYFVPHGRIAGIHHLKRARNSIQDDGSFQDARFQLRSSSLKFLDDFNWAWNSSPFVGTRELNGLKILVMLLSNWDTKDARDFDAASGLATADTNLAIFQDTARSRPRYLYFVSDWGASMGRWGSVPGARSKWNCRDYSEQTPEFVDDTDHGLIRFGYKGKHNDSIVSGIRTTDAGWLLNYLGRVTDDQLRQGLAASGAAPDELACFVQSVRRRIVALQRVSTR